MFVSPFTVSISCDAAIVVIYLQRSGEFGGSPWFVVEDGHGFATELVDVVWLAMLRIAFLLPHVLGFLKRRRLSCPGFHHTFVVANFFFVVAKVVAMLVGGPDPKLALLWWLLLVLSAVSIVAQRGCLHHLRSSMPTPRYKTIFMGSRLDARLLDEQYGHETDSDYDDDDDDHDYSSSEELGRGAGGVDSSSMEVGERGVSGGGGIGIGGSEETKAYLGRVTGACRQSPAKKTERQRTQSRAAHSSARRRRRRRRNRSGSFRHRQESTLELVDYFADRMQEARAAWSARVSALQKRWQASFLSGDGWGVRGGGSPAADRDAALRLTFGLIVRLYAYEDTLEDLRLAAEQDPMCLEAFAPQLASFLVWDSYYMSGQMEAWLLARCSENVYFAHALEFQLRASCLPAAAPAAATAIDGAPAPDAIGGGGGDFLSPDGKNPPALASSRRDSRNSGGSGGGGGSLAASAAEAGGATAEDDDDGSGGGIDRVGRRAVELLLKEIAKNGERAARRLVEEAAEATAAAAAAVRPASLGEGGGGDDSGDESSERAVRAPPAMTAVVAGSQDVAAGAQARTEGGVGGSDVAVGGGGDGGCKGEKQAPLLYRQTLDFLARLGDIASSLTPLSKAERTPVLKQQLAEVGETFLGAGAAAGKGFGDGGNGGERLVYVPVGDRHHRIVAVHPSESFAFSTRERAPCFVCLEVVGAKEPGPGRRRRRGQDGLEEAGGQGEDEEGERSGGGGGGNMLSRRIQALRQWLPSGVSFQQLRFPGSSRGEGLGGGFKGWRLSLDTEESDDVESESVTRQEEEEEGGGARASSAIRVRSDDIEQGGGGTNTNLGVGGGGGSDDERRPRDKYRRRRGGGGGGGRGRPGATDADHYRLLVDEETEGTTSGPGVLPLSSMGNARDWWTANSTGTGRPWGGDDDDVGDDALADVLERRLPTSKPLPEGYTGGSSGSGSSGGADSTGGASRRGSEEEGGESGAGRRGASSPSGDGPPQPQVLFNELWHDKSNRIRRVSPWAEEPGWRLLPVIVKSNDDLRQEQLASQLLFVMQRILRAEGVGVWLRPYDIVALSADTGLVEAVPDTISLDALRRYRGSGQERAKAVEGGDASAAASRF
ncbi:unnamed protein product, partial [Ectocarpus fasciculatus]